MACGSPPERGKTSRQHRLSHRVKIVMTSSSEVMVFSASAPHVVTTLQTFLRILKSLGPCLITWATTHVGFR